MPQASNVLELIGNTPMVKINRLDTGKCELFFKLESLNPGGSIKDRMGLAMIEAAEAEGSLKPGGTIVEATAGNTGLSLALVAVQKGYRAILVVPDKMSREKIAHLRAIGAEVVMTRSDVEKGHPEYYHEVARKIAEAREDCYYINQFSNPNNPKAHYESTAPEIWEQMDRDLDAVVCGVGSGGTISGLSRYFAEHAPSVEVVLADPEGSVMAEYIRTGKHGAAGNWLVEGIGEDYVPQICDVSQVKKAYTISDKESFLMAQELLQKEGLFGGSSSGTLAAAALRYCQEQTEPKRVVAFLCDGGGKYLSKVYNEYWMRDQGFIEGPAFGDLRDAISRLYSEGAVVTVGPDDTLNTAYGRMKLYAISQLPVLEGDHAVGVIDEMDILTAVFQNGRPFTESVRDHMSRQLIAVKPDGDLNKVIDMLHDGYVAVVQDDTGFFGLITRADVLSYLRRQESGAA